MKNWLGQDIVVGSVVYRGAREGNSSSYKVGVVIKVNEDKGTARVEWKFSPGGYYWRKDPSGNHERLPRSVRKMDSSGSPEINSLVLVNVDLNNLEARVELAKEWQEQGMPTALYLEQLEEL